MRYSHDPRLSPGPDPAASRLPQSRTSSHVGGVDVGPAHFCFTWASQRSRSRDLVPAAATMRKTARSCSFEDTRAALDRLIGTDSTETRHRAHDLVFGVVPDQMGLQLLIVNDGLEPGWNADPADQAPHIRELARFRPLPV